MKRLISIKNLIARVPGYYSRHMSIPYNIAVRQDIVDSAFNHTPSKGFSLYKTHLNPSKNNLDCIERKIHTCMFLLGQVVGGQE